MNSLASPLQLNFQRLHPGGTIPKIATAGSAGIDLSAAHDITVLPGCQKAIGTGIAVQIPKGFAGLVCPRSGLAANNSIGIRNAPGIIDSDYRGELKVLAYNGGTSAWNVSVGDRIAQLVIVAVPEYLIVEVAEFSEVEGEHNERGTSGFGSTGK